MKSKIVKIFLFLAACIFFTNCQMVTNDSYSDIDSSLDYTPLFDENDVSITTTSVDLTDGEWIFKKIYVSSSNNPVATTYTLENETVNYSFTSLKIVSVQNLTVTDGYKITKSSNNKSEKDMDTQNKALYDAFCRKHNKTVVWDGTTEVSMYSTSYNQVDNIWVKDACNLAEKSYGIAKRNGSGTRYVKKSNFYNNDAYYFAKIK